MMTPTVFGNFFLPWVVQTMLFHFQVLATYDTDRILRKRIARNLGLPVDILSPSNNEIHHPDFAVAPVAGDHSTVRVFNLNRSYRDPL